MTQQVAQLSDTLDRTFVECSAIGFQAVLTLVLAMACAVLWRRQQGPYFLTWSAAWIVYVLRLACMSTFLVRRDMVWLFLHQTFSLVSALLLLVAALQFSRGFKVRALHAATLPAAGLWAWFVIYGIGDMVVAGVSATLLLSAVTVWTGLVFWRARTDVDTAAARALGAVFIVWGLHHLDYPLLRSFGAAVLYGVFVDVVVLFAIGLGLLFFVLAGERHRLAARSVELEQLTRLMLRVQEDERKRIARELHDEAGQVLTAAKIELELEGRVEAAHLVGRALDQVRNVSNLLRPSALDDLGLVPALRTMIGDFATRTRLSATLDVHGPAGGSLPADVEVAVYRVVQEALTNVARHAGAASVRAEIRATATAVDIGIEDDGRGLSGPEASDAGWLGMRERLAALGGRLEVGTAPSGGVRLAAHIPLGEPL